MKKVIILFLAMLLAIGLTLPMASVGASPGLVGLWHFDDGSGTAATDDSGNSNSGTITGASWVSDQWTGSALSFDGTGDRVVVLDDDSLSVGTAVTVEAWIKPTSSASLTGYIMVVGKWNDGSREYEIMLVDGKVRFYAYSAIPGYKYAESSTTLSVDTWYHVAGVYDGSNLQVYIDGSADGSSTAFTASIPNTAARLTIGEQYWNASWWRGFTGIIDEVRIWSADSPEYTLTSSQVTSFNPVTTDHQITATVTPAVPGITVHFDITGPNSANSGTAVTDGSGVATFTYTGDFGGTDTIHVWIDQDWDGGEDVSASPDLTKQWIVNFVTGGAKINCNNPAFDELGLPNKKTPVFTFGGTVGFLEGVGIVGQFQIVIHSELAKLIDPSIKGAITIHLNSFSYLVFSGGSTGSPPASFNIATFTGTGFSNQLDDVGSVTIIITDNGEPGKGNDTIELFGLVSGPITIDGGNFQVHDIE